MVIAHEITHGFDDQGRRFDADGALREWWTPEDAARFTELADRLVAQFDAYTVLDDVHVNGRLTLGENIADLGGLTLAQRAHARVAAGAPGGRRADAGAAVLPGQRDALARQHQPRAAAHAGRDRPAQPAPAAGARPGLEPGGVPGRVRAPRRRPDHARRGRSGSRSGELDRVEAADDRLLPVQAPGGPVAPPATAGGPPEEEGEGGPPPPFRQRPRSYVSPVRLAGITMTLTAVGSSRPARSAASASSRP